MLDIADRGVGVALLVSQYGLLRVVTGGVIHDNQLFFDVADWRTLSNMAGRRVGPSLDTGTTMDSFIALIIEIFWFLAENEKNADP